MPYTVQIDGNDGTGKTSVIKKLLESEFVKAKGINDIKDRGLLTTLTDVHPDELPDELPGYEKGNFFDENATRYIILDAEPDVSMRRIYNRGPPYDKYDKFPMIFKYRNRFMRLAIKYQTVFIDTTKLTIDQVVEKVLSVLNPNLTMKAIKDMVLILPNPDNYDDDSFDKLPLVDQGHSKIIRAIDSNFTLVGYKPTVYSHKSQREGVVKLTDQERMKMTRSILYILDAEQIPHAYIYIGTKYILCKRLDPQRDIPPIEVIVKKCCVGSDKYRYNGIDRLIGRSGMPIVEPDRREYEDLLVRCDYRNPNHVFCKKSDDPNVKMDTELVYPKYLTEEEEDAILSDPTIYKKPKGDETVCDDLADKFMNVSATKTLARKTFQVLDKHFKKMGIYFEDVCFMITTDGTHHYSEISQDCGRYKKIEENGMTDLDKDIWRAGGSSEHVREKWAQLTVITHDYAKSIY